MFAAAGSGTNLCVDNICCVMPFRGNLAHLSSKKVVKIECCCVSFLLSTTRNV